MKCDECEKEATVAVMNGEVACQHLCGVHAEATSICRMPFPKEECEACHKKAKPLTAVMQPLKKGQVVYRVFCVDCLLPELQKYPDDLQELIAYLEGRDLK